MNHTYPCFYPIFGIPPNSFHFNTALILSHHESIGSVIVIIPNIKTSYISQDQCVELFESYGASYPMMHIRVEKSKFENPFEDIKNRFTQDRHLTGYIAVTEKVARSSEFNNAFGEYDNVFLELVPSNFDKMSKKMQKAIETGDKEAFLKCVPDNMPPNNKEDTWNIVHSEINEQITSKAFWTKIISEQVSIDDVFDTSTTGMPNYDAMLKDPAYYFFFKDQSINLQYMTPEEYLKLCAKDVHDTNLKGEIDSIDKHDAEVLAKRMKAGDRMDTPILNVADKSQEGRHRCIAAKSLGYNKVPVYVISKVAPVTKKFAKSVLRKVDDFKEAKERLDKEGIPLDEKTFDKIKWQEAKYSDK